MGNRASSWRQGPRCTYCLSTAGTGLEQPARGGGGLTIHGGVPEPLGCGTERCGCGHGGGGLGLALGILEVLSNLHNSMIHYAHLTCFFFFNSFTTQIPLGFIFIPSSTMSFSNNTEAVFHLSLFCLPIHLHRIFLTPAQKFVSIKSARKRSSTRCSSFYLSIMFM